MSWYLGPFIRFGLVLFSTNKSKETTVQHKIKLCQTSFLKGSKIENKVVFALGFLITTDTEYSAVVRAMEWARPGDFLALLVHDDRIETMQLLDKLTKAGWQAGDPLPA